MSPLVALTTGMMPSASPERLRVGIYANYLAALEHAGLTPVLVTPAHSPESVRALLDVCCGLVLSGGEDIDPARYGEAPIPQLAEVDPLRDEVERLALELALERDLPVLAICRGCQLLNVAYGGTLYQDLAVQRPESSLHEQAEPWSDHPFHTRVTPGSRLDEIVHGQDLWINSFHHQAVRDVGPGLEVAAVAEDGVIEAVEATDHEWVIGVQWHPERHEATAPETDPNRQLLVAFARAVAERREAGQRAAVR